MFEIIKPEMEKKEEEKLPTIFTVRNPAQTHVSNKKTKKKKLTTREKVRCAYFGHDIPTGGF